MKILLLLLTLLLSSCDFSEAEGDDGDIFINHIPYKPEIFFTLNNHPTTTRNPSINIIITTSDSIEKMSVTNTCSSTNWQNYSNNFSYTLAKGITNTIAIRLKDDDSYSSCSTITIFQDNSAEQIANLESTNRTYDSITLGWVIPVSENPITDYTVQYKETINSTWLNHNDGLSNDNSLTVTGLTEETSYDFRIRSFNGNYSQWSEAVTVETPPNLSFFEDPFRAINVGGAITNQVVSLDNGNQITIKDISAGTETNITLNKGELHNFDADQFDEIIAQGPFYVAGRIGNAGVTASAKANVTWSTSSWVGKKFYINLTRNEPLSLKVFAFQNTIITIYQAGVEISTHNVNANEGDNISIAAQGSYEIVSTGFIVAYAHATVYTDPFPLLPASNDIIGFPSNSAKITSSADDNDITAIHSNSTEETYTFNRGVTESISPQGSTTTLYQSNSLRILSEEGIVAISNADSNGYCSAPFIPVSMLKNKFAINVDSDYIAFASDVAATITITYPDLTTQEITLTRSGANANAPYSARIANTIAGTIMESDKKFQAWYQPSTDTYGSAEDETILFGW